MTIAVVNFPGSLDGGQVTRALEAHDAQVRQVWHTDAGADSGGLETAGLEGVDAVILPGGAAFGDALRPGALAKLSPIAEPLREIAARGVPILGIGNGFQILTELGLLPGTLLLNASGSFIGCETDFEVSCVDTPWTRELRKTSRVTLPVLSKYGRYFVDETEAKRLQDEDRVVLQFADENLTGSSEAIAGVANAAGNVVGLLPHVEHAAEAGFGTDGVANRSQTDGLRFLTSILV